MWALEQLHIDDTTELSVTFQLILWNCKCKLNPQTFVCDKHILVTSLIESRSLREKREKKVTKRRRRLLNVEKGY